MNKPAKWSIGILAVAIVAAQFIRPDRTNPPFDKAKDLASVSARDSAIAPLLHRACYDCHSFETRWPWYSNVAPVSWFVADDVHEARGHLNFSLWGEYPPYRKETALDHIHNQVKSGDMPLWTYLQMHPHAHLTQADRDSIVRWADGEQDSLGER
jgi:hypothetical protein